MPLNQKYHAQFEHGEYYHVFNRSAHKQTMFRTHDNYLFFLNLFRTYLLDYVDVFSYCLIPNHFHFLIQVLNKEILANIDKRVVNQFRKLFNAYTNSYNEVFDLRGPLFSTPFRRIRIEEESYFSHLVYYHHFNPVHHNICSHPSEYQHSSYNSLLSNKPTLLQRERVFDCLAGGTIL